MRVLFLDIDGVLNSIASRGFWHRFERPSTFVPHDDFKQSQSEEFCPISLENLKYICREIGDLKIIISSTWRKGHTDLARMKGWFPGSIIAERIIGKTPYMPGSERGKEIGCWLIEHPEVTRFAVVDDDSDMEEVWENFFQTDVRDGLTRTVAGQIVHHLKGEDTGTVRVKYGELHEHYMQVLGATEPDASFIREELKNLVKKCAKAGYDITTLKFEMRKNYWSKNDD